MNDIEITRSLALDATQSVALDTHSCLNILNMLNLELSDLAQEYDLHLHSQCDQIFAIAQDLSCPPLAYERIARLNDDITAIRQHLEEQLAAQPGRFEHPKVRAAVDDFDAILAVLRSRIIDLQARSQRLIWRDLDIATVLADMNTVLRAIEKASKGRFRIFDNLALQGEHDYYIDFKIHSPIDPILRIPPVFIDVIRDLLANARKYTPPGGRISAGIANDGAWLHLCVEDSGCGIPAGEIDSVIDFGQRATNVRTRRTMGNGLGLTKAYVICKQFGGRFWIRSELERGTRVRLLIPVPVTATHATSAHNGDPG